MALPSLLEAGKDGMGWKRWRNIPGECQCLPCPGASGIINPCELLGAAKGLLGDVWDKEKLQKHPWRFLVYMVGM